MRYLIFISFLFLTIKSFSQNTEIPQLKMYEDLSSKLYVSKVIEVSDKSQKELQNTFKNWASMAFVNLKEVMVSETDNQIVLLYVADIPVTQKILGLKVVDNWPMYVRLVAEFKEGKIRVSLFDDGNAQYAYFPTRSIYISNYNIPPKSKREFTQKNGSWYIAHTIWQNRVDTMVKSIEYSITKPFSTAPIMKNDF